MRFALALSGAMVNNSTRHLNTVVDPDEHRVGRHQDRGTGTPDQTEGVSTLRTLNTEKTMATDYDAPRKQDEESKDQSFEELRSRPSEMQSGAVDEDENAAAESFELPGADLSNEELNVVVLPAQDDEFTCASCFLVRHRSQIAREEGDLKFCIECES